MSANMSIRDLARAAREVSVVLSRLPTSAKRAVLLDMAAAIEGEALAILRANATDVESARVAGRAPALIDRLLLDANRIAAIAAAVRAVAELPDPVGEVTRREERPNGLVVERVRIPLGVIAMIYEARPNVTADAAALCFMAGTDCRTQPSRSSRICAGTRWSSCCSCATWSIWRFRAAARG
jgi:glutamate-5-semialdehyde dehydrogenase